MNINRLSWERYSVFTLHSHCSCFRVARRSHKGSALEHRGAYLKKSPVGYASVPFPIGGRGWVFHSNWELAF